MHPRTPHSMLIVQDMFRRGLLCNTDNIDMGRRGPQLLPLHPSCCQVFCFCAVASMHSLHELVLFPFLNARRWSARPLICWSAGPMIWWPYAAPLVRGCTCRLVRWSTRPLLRCSTGPKVCWSDDLRVYWSIRRVRTTVVSVINPRSANPMYCRTKSREVP